MTINCVVANEWAGIKTVGKLHLVDLAGSERLAKSNAQGDRLKETQAINSSLSALGNVLQALVTAQRHVPFRDSRLTMMLSDSLGGNAKVLLVLCVKDGDADADESLQTLQWGQRARKVKLGEAKRNLVEVAPARAASEVARRGPAKAMAGEGAEEQVGSIFGRHVMQEEIHSKVQFSAPFISAGGGTPPPSIKGGGKSKPNEREASL